MPFKHLDDISISDVAFSAWGKTIEGMFLASAQATLSLVLENPESLKETVFLEVEIKEESLEMLLFNYLQELIFYKDAKELLLRAEKPVIKKNKNGFLLKGKLKGEKINPKKHKLASDIKAVTLSNFRIERKKNNWQVTLVLDV